MRLTHLLILAGVVAVLGVFILAFAGIIGIGPINQRNLNRIVDLVVQRGSGYSAAKTPNEAMTNFRMGEEKGVCVSCVPEPAAAPTRYQSQQRSAR